MTDLEKLKELYTSWDLKLDITFMESLEQYCVDIENQEKFESGYGFTCWYFDKNGKFLYQEASSQ